MGELHALFTREVAGMVSTALKLSAVTVHPTESAAATRLKITPISARTDCAGVGCSHGLWLDVELFDSQEEKPVWSARFLVSAPGNTNDAIVVRRFADTLIARLKSSNLL